MTAPVTTLLTPVRRHIIEFVRAFVDEWGFPPSVREIAEAIGLSSSTAQYHLQCLYRAGWMHRATGKPRAIVVLDPADGSDGEEAA